MGKKEFTTSEVAKLLGISRVAVFKKIKAGEIMAKKIGRNFIIDARDLPEILGAVLTKKRKKDIELAVEKTIREYGEALKLLGQE